jgi:23S rRNA (guanosine2251-2'-O)-methyltransferase
VSDQRLVIGLQPVREAIAAHGARLGRVLVENRDVPQLDALARFARDRGATVDRTSRAELDRLARGGRHQGAACFAPTLTLVSLEELAPEQGAPVLALDELEDPQNFGAIVRSAVALGASGILFPEHHSAPLTPATFRASAGAVEHARLCRVPALPTALGALRERGAKVVGLDANGTPIGEVDLSGGVVLVVGAEGKGLRRPVRAACDVVARLPLAGPIASLNASVAAALGLWEVVRRR